MAGGIPVINATLREGLAGNRIDGIAGIINGTSNYILTQMRDAGLDFADALADAQRLGYAEADPSFDIDGVDAAHKLAILTCLAFGTAVPLKEIYTEGVDKVTPLDIAFAEEFGYKIKLLAIAKAADGEIEARVHPTMIPKEYLLSRVGGVHNAIYLVGEAIGEALFYGRGAGSLPTGSAVVSDLIDISRNILKGASGRVPPASFLPEARPALRIKQMDEIESLYYLRFMAEDRPGVLSKISGVLGKHRISISSVIQQGRKAGGNVPLVMMTHRAKERDVQEALSKINRMDYVSEPTMLIRVEGEDE
ncbi:MAG: homoserine dehydrogenase [Candidatus Manganitrophus sp.]|nr:MAG: homoserine dehydrogenase [Candidatus Manganitrophus sp.]